MCNYLFSKSRTANQEQWAQLIEQYQESGLTQENFCIENGLALSTFRYWLRKIGAVPACQSEIEFVEIDKTDLFSSEPLCEVSGKDMTVSFYPGADPDLISMVIRELGL